MLRLGPEPTRPALAVIPIALVGAPGGGGGAAAEVGAAAPPPAVAAPVAALASPSRARPVAPRAPVPRAAPAEAPAADGTAATGSGEGAGGAGPGTGGGDGSGGDGSGGARVAYGTNPKPPYPLAARRLGQEGVVLLEILVGADGAAREVRVARSSGFPLLDDSAERTVRARWRFIPARRGGTAVESRVTVPIRFRLEDARG